MEGRHMDYDEVKLFVDVCDGKPVYEMVPSRKIGPNHYLLLASPGFATGVASGDEIEFVPSEKTGYRVVKRSGNICVQLFLNKCEQHERLMIADIVRAIGGWLDGGKDSLGIGSLLIFTIPISKGFGAIEQAMSQITERFDVDRWMYGNVYNTADGTTPLNWWNTI